MNISKLHIPLFTLIAATLLLAPSAAQLSLAASGIISAPTMAPFLQPPFARQYRVTSYFDHQYPNYAWDDSVVIFNGEQASAIDGIVDRTATFRGGYYLPDTKWYVYYDGHNGFDYGTRGGVTVLAAAPGKVVFAGSTPSGCATPLQFVRIDHGNGYSTSYLHLEGIVVREGQQVETGDPLGISGNSGCSLGAHLHFAVRHGDYYTDPYGWTPTDRPDPQIAYSGEPAVWLWAPEQPLKPIGKLTQPEPGARANGDLTLTFVSDSDSPPVVGVEFLAFYENEWHALGTDKNGADGWTMVWDTRSVPEGEVWLHAWAIGDDGRVGKGSPIVTDVVIDRTPPRSSMVSLRPDSVAGGKLWLYALSNDPESTTRQVTFLIRPSSGGEWREIGDAQRIHFGGWLLEWQPNDVPDHAQIDIVARLTDGAGNSTLAELVERVTIDRAVVGDGMISPQSGIIFTGTLDLAFTPIPTDASVQRVEFYAWYDAAWHLVQEDANGNDGWQARWNPTGVEDQPRVRIQACVYDAEGRVNAALLQATDLTLDRTPPQAGYIRPATGGVVRPDTPLTAWASDAGSGVAFVEFYINLEKGWLKIGEDRNAGDGWSLLWDAPPVADGSLTFGIRAFDRAGNSAWGTDSTQVTLDREPPTGRFVFPSSGMGLRGKVTLRLDMADAASGLDRAIFYAWYDDHWHHLGFDQTPQDGLSVVWDTAPMGPKGDVKLTAWVYDRAGNVVELPSVERLALGGYIPPTDTPAPTAILTATPADTPTIALTPSPTATPTAMPADTPTIVPTSSPTATPTNTATSLPSPTMTLMPTASPTPLPTQTATPTATPLPTFTPLPTSTPEGTPVPDHLPIPAAFWYLIGVGIVIGVILMILAIRHLRATRR